MLTQDALDLLGRLAVNKVSDSYSKEYEQLILHPVQRMLERLVPFLLRLDQAFVIPARGSWVKRYKSSNLSLCRDSLKATFQRDKALCHPAPFFQISLTPFYFGMTVSYQTMSREMMDILRSMAIGRTPLFCQAWNAYTTQSYFKLCGPHYGKSRFLAYEADIRPLLDCRLVIFRAQDTNLQRMLDSAFFDFLIEKLKTISPLYQLLLEVTQQQGRYRFDPYVFDPWNIRQPIEEME